MVKSPLWFRVVAMVALLWNVLGCLAFAADLRLTPEDIATLPDAQQVLYNARPVWAIAGTAVAVVGGVLGCVALLLGRTWALPVFVASLAGVVIQDAGWFAMAGAVRATGPDVLILQGLVLLIASGLIVLSRKGTARGWLH